MHCQSTWPVTCSWSFEVDGFGCYRLGHHLIWSLVTLCSQLEIDMAVWLALAVQCGCCWVWVWRPPSWKALDDHIRCMCMLRCGYWFGLGEVKGIQTQTPEFNGAPCEGVRCCVALNVEYYYTLDWVSREAADITYWTYAFGLSCLFHVDFFGYDSRGAR